MHYNLSSTDVVRNVPCGAVLAQALSCYATCGQTLLCLLKVLIVICEERAFCVKCPIVAMLGTDAGLSYHVTHLHILG